MAVTAIEEQGRARGAALMLPLMVAAVVYCVVLAVGGNLLNDPDTYWHVAVGDWILAHGFPTSDPFSFTFAGHHWIAKEWLSQLLYDGAWHLAGWPGVAVLAAVAIALTFLVFAWLLERELAVLPVVAFAAAAFMLAAPHLVARPHVLAMPVMVAWVGGVVSAADRGKAPSFWLLPLMVLWANLHGGFTLGILLAGAAGLDALVSAERQERKRTFLVWARFGVLTLIAAAITPYGPESMLVTWRVLSLGPALSIIAEWQPADFAHLGGLEIVLLLGLGFAFYRGFVLKPVRILVLLGLLHMALSAERNAEVLGLAAPLFLAAPLARQFAGLRAETATGEAGRRPLVAALVVALLVPVTWAAASFLGYAPSARATPERAVQALDQAGASRVLNDYDFGGYLVHVGRKTFIDGRTELYGGAFTARDDRAVNLADLPDFLKLLDAYRIDATLLAPNRPAVALLDRLPGWKRLYADPVAVVHVRVDAEKAQ